MTSSEFDKYLADNGYSEAKRVGFDPGVELHTHDFSAMVMVAKGEFTIGYEDGDTVYRPGDVYELVAGTLHVERTGDVGAVILAGRK
ncbi:MAG: cupin domain-containing protein [Acidimicrobiales bacterium]